MRKDNQETALLLSYSDVDKSGMYCRLIQVIESTLYHQIVLDV